MASSSDDEDDMSFYDAPAGSDARFSFEPDGETPRDAMTSLDWPGRETSAAQLNSNAAAPARTPPPIAAATRLTRLRRRTLESLQSSSRVQNNRHSLPEPVPAIPAIPEHFLALGKRATVAQRRLGDPRKEESPSQLNINTTLPTLHIQRPSTSGGEIKTPRGNAVITRKPSPQPRPTRRKSLPPLTAHKDTLEQLESGFEPHDAADMNRLRSRRNEDLFMELGDDQAGDEPPRPLSRSGRISSRLSYSGKRRSLPAESALPSAENRPRTSGHTFGNRPSSRMSNFGSDLHRHVEQYRTAPSRQSFQADDAVSIGSRSRSGRPLRYSNAAERPPVSPSIVSNDIRSPELPHYGRRRPSFGTNPPTPHKVRPTHGPSRLQDAHSDSPAESSDPKQSLPDSASVESQPEDTVWDELDDLKSRIKKLELTGKLPATSGAAVSSESTNERPRTATTAPTTIDSSPKHEKPANSEKKPELEPEPEVEPVSATVEASAEYVVGGPNAANIHPLLHSALAKAKPLINGSLYRTLEATASDALQLAAMTGSAGPQGTAYSAAAIINGVTVSDRHVRRKADTMCRNLTDLCLALCEGKHEAAGVFSSSPITLDTPAKSSPTVRYPRSSLGPNDGMLSRSVSGSRPMSRLEARRTSILGSQAGGSSIGNSPVASGGEDVSASEQESTPSSRHHLRVQEPRRVSRVSSRLQASRMQRYDDVSGDEDPTLRPASRAMTDAASVSSRAPASSKQLSANSYNTPPHQRSSPGTLRDSLVARRQASANGAAYEGNRELTRVASLTSESSGGRRRFLDPSTPPVLEEEVNDEDQYPQSAPPVPIHQPKRRVMSFGQHGNAGPSRRATADLNRTGSLNQRRHVVVE